MKYGTIQKSSKGDILNYIDKYYFNLLLPHFYFSYISSDKPRIWFNCRYHNSTKYSVIFIEIEESDIDLVGCVL